MFSICSGYKYLVTFTYYNSFPWTLHIITPSPSSLPGVLLCSDAALTLQLESLCSCICQTFALDLKWAVTASNQRYEQEIHHAQIWYLSHEHLSSSFEVTVI